MLVRDTGIEPVADCYLRTRKLRRWPPHPVRNGAGVVVSVQGLTRHLGSHGCDSRP
jgi:hypothetical protein